MNRDLQMVLAFAAMGGVLLNVPVLWRLAGWWSVPAVACFVVALLGLGVGGRGLRRAGGASC